MHSIAPNATQDFAFPVVVQDDQATQRNCTGKRNGIHVPLTGGMTSGKFSNSPQFPRQISFRRHWLSCLSLDFFSILKQSSQRNHIVDPVSASVFLSLSLSFAQSQSSSNSSLSTQLAVLLISNQTLLCEVQTRFTDQNEHPHATHMDVCSLLDHS